MEPSLAQRSCSARVRKSRDHFQFGIVAFGHDRKRLFEPAFNGNGSYCDRQCCAGPAARTRTLRTAGIASVNF
jgi:hypothetical protein